MSGEWDTNPIDYIGRLVYKKSDIGKSILAGEYSLYDFNHAMTGFIKISFNAIKTSKILLIFHEICMNENVNIPAYIRYDRNG